MSRLRFFGNTPNAARNVLEDLGLIVFVCIVGINAGNSLLAQLTGALALKIFVVGFIACSDPALRRLGDRAAHLQDQPRRPDGRRRRRAQPFAGRAARRRSRSSSNVPWIGFPVAYAVSGVLLTVFGYFAMVLAQ